MIFVLVFQTLISFVSFSMEENLATLIRFLEMADVGSDEGFSLLRRWLILPLYVLVLANLILGPVTIPVAKDLNLQFLAPERDDKSSDAVY